MFFILSKTIYFLAMPLTLVIILLITSRVLRRRKYKKRAFNTALLLIFIFSNTFLINEVLLIWEIEPRPFDQVTKTYEVGIVLTGITNMEKSPHDRVHFNEGADRITHTLQLYRQGAIKKILISGGSGSMYLQGISESKDLKDFLLLCQVPEEDILLEEKSRNTHENAKFSTELIRNLYPDGDYLLITSAFHMRRAYLCFKKEGLSVDQFSSDFYTHDRNFHFQELFVPNIYAFQYWTVLFREIIGIIFYTFVGYI